MKSKGKIYKKHFSQAKYVIKGKKLKTSTAVVKKRDMDDIGSILMSKESSDSVFDATEVLSDIIRDDMLGFEKFDFNDFDIEEIEIEPNKGFNEKTDIKDDNNFSLYGDLAISNKYSEVKDEKSFEKQIEEKVEEISKAYRQKEEKVEEISKIHGQNEKKVEEISKNYIPKEKKADVKQKQIQKQILDKETSKNTVDKVDKIVVKREDKVEKLNEKERQAEEERIRLLNLARQKKENLEKEKIRKAMEKKAEKLNKSVDNKKDTKGKKVVPLENSNKKKKKRKDESKSFIIVAALLAIIIVAGIANIGKTMYDEIYKDKTLVGENDNKDDKSSLLDNIGLFKPDNTRDEVDTNKEIKTEDKQVVATDDPSKVANLDQQEVTIAPGNNVITSDKIVSNDNNLKEYVDNTKKNNSNNSSNFNIYVPPLSPVPEGETGVKEPTETERYVEIQYSEANFKLYKTTKNNISKSAIRAGQICEYTKSKVSGSTIKIPVSDANGLWFIMVNNEISEQFAFDGDLPLGVATLKLMHSVDGQDVLEDIIYVKQGTSVNLGGTYCIRDDEGVEVAQYTTIQNPVGTMVLYKK